MWFVAIGCVLIAIKLVGVTAIAAWSWWWILSPFAAAAVWWLIADATGDTQRRAMERVDLSSKVIGCLLASNWSRGLPALLR